MKKKTVWKAIACLCVMALVMSLLAGCGNSGNPVYVQTVAEIMGYTGTGAFNTSSGVVMAQEEVKIDRDMDKEISGLCVEVGQTVSEGDVLFIYKTGNISLQIDKVNLEIEQMKNQISDIKSQITQLEKEKKNANESDKLAYTLQIQSLQTDQKEAEYNLSLKQRELQELKDNTDTGEVKSPISGQVKKINKDGGYDMYTGNPLPYIVLSTVGEYRVKGTVNELNREELFVGQSVIIRSRIDSSVTWTGTITSVETQAEENNNYYYGSDDMYSSSSYPFYVSPDSSEGMLLGQHVFIEPNYGQATTAEGLWLDASYICMTQSDGAYFVWGANKSDKITKLFIEIGEFDANLNCYQILSGLSKTDRIAFPNEDIKEGAPITEILLHETEDGLDSEGESFEDEFGGMEEEGWDGEMPVDDGIADFEPDMDGAYNGDEDASPVVDGVDPFELELPQDEFSNDAPVD